VTPGGVSPDHLYSINTTGSGATPLAVEGHPTIYLGNPDGSFELVGLGSLGSEPYPEARYVGEGGGHIVFSTGHDITQSEWCRSNEKCKVVKLEPNAPPEGTGAVYDRSADGPTHVVSLLPGDVTPAAGEEAFYKGTSEDGTAVAFEIEGTLYVRLDNTETKEVAAGSPLFAGLSDDGHYVFYVSEGGGEAGNIHRFDTGTEADVKVNTTGDAEIVNVSGDGSHVYFVSPSQIGGEGEAGQPNLYVWGGSPPEYLATVVPSDLERTSGELSEQPALTNWTDWVANRLVSGTEQGPGADSSRTTPDGGVLVFESRAQLTTYDNAGHTEIYRYDDEDKSLLCVSCNLLAEPASADARLQELDFVNSPMVIHNLSDNGSRVFFETGEALIERDSDGINDIYEWEQEEGGTSVDLISSGSSVEYPPSKVATGFRYVPPPNVLLSVTSDGSDVVFLSEDALVRDAGEGGASAIYDARVNGGFQPPTEPTACLEEGCRPAAGLAPSPFLNSASESLRGSGNVKPRKHRCRHPKRNKHRRCTRQRSKHRRTRTAATSKDLGADDQQATQAAVAGSAPNRLPGRGVSGTSSPSTQAEEPPKPPFGIEVVDAKLSTSAAAMHSDFTTEITLNHTLNGSGEPEFNNATEEVTVALPPGLLGNPNAIPQCTTGEFVAVNCPVKSQVGVTTALVTNAHKSTQPIYNLAPPHPEDEVARLGFIAKVFPVFIDIQVRTASDYGATGTVYGSSGLASLVSAVTTLWGNPADPSHDTQRFPKGPSGLPPTAFMTNPSACQPMAVDFSARSYQLPGQLFSATAPMDPIGGCSGLPFAPSLEARPTSDVAAAPTGLKAKLAIPQSSDPEVPSTATMREARVTLPEGLTINPGAADGLAACSDEEVHFHEEVDAQCPDASKLGTVEIKSPPLPRPVEGALYQRSPQGKGNLFGLWLVSDDLGLHIKIPGKVAPDPNTGRLTAVFSDLPQVPVSEIDLDVWGGARAPLKNPDTCGTYQTTSAFSPHSEDPAATPTDSFLIDRGPNGGPCPSAASEEPNSPELEAGTQTPIAATFTPFLLRLHREDGSQQFGALTLTLPPGLTGRLAGLDECSEAALAAAAAKSGAEEKANPSCPASSLLGSVWAAAGAGPAPFWAKGQAYLAAPYKGAPLSVAIITPAVAGPFDLGTVVVRSALRLEPGSARITVISDPIPSILEGVALNVRTVAVQLDRERFTLNGTSCEPLAFEGSLLSTLGNPASLKERFQLGECGRLKFKPKLDLELQGKTERTGFPALRATYRARPGDANLASLKLRFPRSEFIEQGHFRTICTRTQWAAGQGGGTACPKGSIYGHIRAATPLLDKPLQGPVYLRSSDHNLPDVVFALRGQVDAEVAVRIDSVKGGLQARIEEAPDVPIAKALLTMQGGQKGLFVNSRDTCAHAYRAKVGLEAHNGRTASLRPALENRGCGKAGRGAHKHKH